MAMLIIATKSSITATQPNINHSLLFSRIRNLSPVVMLTERRMTEKISIPIIFLLISNHV